MAEGGKRGDGRGLEETKERSRSFDDHSDLFLMGAKRNLSRGILIHLTGTESEWDSLDDDELIFSLDHGEDDVCKSPSKETPRPAEDQSSLKSFHVPLSPSSPESLGNCSPAGPSFLSPGPSSPSPRPLASLVKSLSTELEPKEGTTFGPRPLLSLVKSISTELSRSEPEVSQSKSDSRLNLHLWRQLTQTRARSSEDSRTAPPSPSGDGLKGGFFKAELEDTRRKFSEAVHEPLSCVFGKIMGEESPKHQSGSGRRGPGRDGSIDAAPSESPVRTARRADGEALPVFEWPSVRRLARGQPGLCPIHHQGQRPREQELEICADANTMQMIAVRTLRGPSGSEAPQSSEPPRPPPRTSLFCIAVLSYAYFILPLGPYVSGLALGLALGFLLALFLIRVGSCGSGRSAPDHSTALTQLGKSRFTDGFTSTEPETLKGWMNEIHEYDPETCHPALTHSVFATLEGSRLHLDVPRTNISRRAAHDKRLQEATFVKSRCFHLAKSKVFLLPSVLARKRVWNPKYPICIQLDGGGPSPDEDEEGASAESPTSEPVADRAATASPTSTNQTGDAPARLYLFGRTGREKEEWFRRFQLASVDKEVEKERDVPRPRTGLSRSADPAENVHVPRSRGPSSEDKAPPSPPATRRLPVLDYHRYMARLLAADEMTPLSSPGAGSAEASPTFKANCSCQHINSSTTAWANALIGRIFWDLLREKPWADAISRKIQRKLGKIRLPYFMSGLTLTELDMGCSVPQITATSRPEVNHRGLWVELQLVYTGNLQMTLQTNFNLSKLGKEGSQETAHSFTDAGSTRPVLSVLADSDEESSSAASSDEEELLLSEPHCPAAAAAPEGTGGGKTGRKILRFVDKIAKSKCFQRAAENEFIKKKFEEMSNTPLLLSVEVRELSGTLVVNIPAPPTDRIWYSFCEPPKLDLHVCPKLGEREVTFCHVTEWIEKKLQDEFQKVFVLPNMDDIYVALMESGMDDPS